MPCNSCGKAKVETKKTSETYRKPEYVNKPVKPEVKQKVKLPPISR